MLNGKFPYQDVPEDTQVDMHNPSVVTPDIQHTPQVDLKNLH